MATPGTLNVGRSLMHGSAWMVAMRWSVRGLGLINTFVLARLLSPSDFGLVAMAMLVVGLVEALGDTGQLLALIRHPNPGRADYNSVWTLGIMVCATITVVLWLLSPLASLYFHEPRASGLVKALALRTLIGGFFNVGTVAFRRELDFAREFRFLVLQRALTLVATIGVALWLRDYRALVVGIIGGQLLSVILSYVMHPYRPRLDVSKISAVWGFSGWMLVVHVAQYAQDKADEWVVGTLTSASAMGTYNVGADVATAPTVEIVVPMTRALFPIFSKIAHDPVALRRGFLDVFAATMTICCACAVGMALVARDFVAVALGPQWTHAVPLVQVLAFSGGLYGIMQGVITLLSSTDHVRLSAVLATTRTLVTVPVLIAAGLLGDVLTIAIARTVVTALLVPGVFFTLLRVLPISAGDILRPSWRPVCAAAGMAAAVRLLYPASVGSPALRLAIEVAVGAAAFVLAMLLLWACSGRPDGPEAAVVARARAWLRLRPAAG